MLVLVSDALDEAISIDEDALGAAAGARSLTWGELDTYASAMAVALERRGVEPGDRVAMLVHGLDAVVAFWAIARAGAVGVALHSEDSGELAASLRDFQARALVVDASLAPEFHHAIARSPDVRVAIVRGHAAGDHAGTAVYVAWDTALAEDDFETMIPRRIDLDEAWLEREGSSREDLSVRALSHRVLLARASSLARGLDLSDSDDVSGTAFAETAIACALSGACFRVWESDVVAIEGRTRARALFLHGGDEEAPPPAGAEPVAIYRHPVCGPIAVLAGDNEPARVLANVDIRIVDEKGATTPHKVVGEIAVRSSSGLTRAGEYVKTGDSGMLDDSGALYVL
jgi:acyl-CoA synthetase (AMP-forming)/AMP-acid ligase II